MARTSRSRVLGPAALAAFFALAAAARADDKARADAAKQLEAALSEIVSKSALAGARVGVLVTSLDTGRVLFAHGADELLNPASNVKLFTAAAALARLGPEFRFDTELWVDGRAPAGMPRALYVRGKGDPSMTTERLWALAGDLAHLGLRSVKELVIDDSYFDGEREGPGFDQERGDRSYLAPAAALSLNFNNVAVHVAPGSREGDKGRVELEPPSDFFVLENRTVTARASALRRVTPSSTSDGARQRVVVQARLPLGSRDQVFLRKIDDPPLYFGHTLRRLLEKRGVKVGKVRRGAVPADARLLHVAQSESLGDIARRLLKTSNNFVAEQILKTLGAEAKGAPGTWPKGVEAVEDFLAEVGLPRGSYLMKNGSGLNDANRFSARQTVTLLAEMWRRFPLMAEFVGALPVAGKDGTIKWRMEGTDAVGHLRAKTGTLESVTSLSGYVETKGRERLAFAILVNDYPGRAGPVVRAVDALGSALAASGGPPTELAPQGGPNGSGFVASTDLRAAVAAVTAQPPPAPGSEALADLEAHVAMYYRLARAGDRRNVPFLRTALRTERDPVLEMAAAEAIYLSDRDSETGQRTFVDSIVTDGGAFERLRALAADLGLPVPILGSLGDLAAEGSPEALSRLVELTPPAAAAPAVADAFADTWTEVARNAPDETLAALRAASAGAATATLDMLARGLAHGREIAHPFPEAVRRAAAGEEVALAEFARALLPRLEERVHAIGASNEADAAAPAKPVQPPQPETKRGGG